MLRGIFLFRLVKTITGGLIFMKKLGNQTIMFDNPITITSAASIVGPKESGGPMAKYFDKCLEDEFWQEKTWEKAESKIIKETVNMSIVKSGISAENIDYCFAGDLLNQCISSSFGLRELNIPFSGIFGACFTAHITPPMIPMNC